MPLLPRRLFLRHAGRAAAGVALGAGFAVRAQAQTLAPIVAAAIAADISAEAYYAQDMGFFKRAGLDAKIVPFTNGASIAAAVAGGAADFGYSNVISLAVAHTKGLPFVILAPANVHVHGAPTAGILAVKTSSAIAGAKDLTGKVIAVSGIGNIADIATREWIDQNGGDSKSVKFVEVPFPQMTAALIAGRIDAAAEDATGDVTAGKPDDPLRRLGSTFDAVAPRFAPSVWFTTTDWIAKHPAAARGVVAALHETAAWANAHRPESAAILAKYTQQPAEAIQSVRRVTYGDRLTPESIQPNIDVAAKYGIIKAAFPASDLIAVLP